MLAKMLRSWVCQVRTGLPNSTMYFLEDKEKMRITKLARKQITIGSNLKSILIHGVQALNWMDDKLQSTLHRELMLIESIYDKK